MDGEGPRFVPLRPASPRARAVVLLVGPLLWLVALVVLAYVVRQRNAVGIAVVVTAVSFVFWTLVLLLMRARRRREEES